jgi:uncharacterized protein
MSNYYDPNSAAPGAFADSATAVDAGLRAHMLRVYNYMAVGVGLTGLVAMLTYRLTASGAASKPTHVGVHACVFCTGVLHKLSHQYSVA